MTIELNAKDSQLIQELVESGQFATPEDAISAGIQTLATDDFTFEELEELLRPALEEIRRDESIPHDEAMRQLDEQIDAYRKRPA